MEQIVTAEKPKKKKKRNPMTADQKALRNARIRERRATDPDYRARVNAREASRRMGIYANPDQRALKNARERERYATDSEYRERVNARNSAKYKERCLSDPGYREKHGASKADSYRRRTESRTLGKMLTDLIRKAISNSKQRGHQHPTINESDLMEMWKAQRGRCKYSGIPLTRKPRCKNTISIDRADSSRGYERGNVNLVAAEINRIKNDVPLDEFLSICRAVAAANPEAK